MQLEQARPVVGDDTRERLLTAALSQFAERGFYGASIAQIAGELDLTKQALLYYFKRKEDLYSEVLRRISQRLLSAMRSGVDENASPDAQFEGMILAIYEEAMKRPLDTRVLLRELLENQERAEKAGSWYLKPFLNEIVEPLNRVEDLMNIPAPRKFAAVYQMLGAIEYFAISRPTLSRMYGEAEYHRIAQAFPAELRAQIRRFIECGQGC
ncbi:MAG: TetR/AcrR family transcriptional regulator [Erythrobacter sp.]|uniref:TetR/AcrR family transcriptional regulator n=1 Tax=Erythrobacter sp. TaxID=1042 RepID=UPI0026393F59|nr:TetR/AcrR family transcriptional regulator [Erythrobacter sp.]MDJ0979119.1 TetR/AcrR family transcriptional regulator [Erythrobacter sp.]